MPQLNELAKALERPEFKDEEDATLTLSALIVSAARDQQFTPTLESILSVLSASQSASLLDPLNLAPILLPHSTQYAQEILTLMAKYSSAKELYIVLQEALERLLSDLDDLDEDEPTNNNELTYAFQLVRLIELYSTVVPRLTLRSKTALEVLRPLLSELSSAITLVCREVGTAEGRALIRAMSHLVRDANIWIKANTPAEPADSSKCVSLLSSSLLETIGYCESAVSSSLAQRTFEAYYPRLVLRSAVTGDWQSGVNVLSHAFDTYTSLGLSPRSLVSRPSVGSLVLLAHMRSPPVELGLVLASFGPSIISCVQNNVALDANLALLLKCLHHMLYGPPRNDIPPDIIVPLSHILPALASAHPGAPTRHLIFRILSLLLAVTPSAPRLQLLNDLLTDPEISPPQMRVAAVGLAKESVLEALSKYDPVADNADVFASPMFLQVLGPSLLRPDPPHLFWSTPALSEFLDSSEPERLVECLGLYYVLLRRDALNLTGIRDSDQVINVQQSLLKPLRAALCVWTEQDTMTQNVNDHRCIMVLAALETNLGRIDDALASLH